MDADDQRSSVDPSEQRGGTTPGEQEAAEKGPWAAKAAEGVVPAELGGSDAPREMLDDDPELGSSVLGATTGLRRAGHRGAASIRDRGRSADATTDGGPEVPSGVEPDLKDAASGARQVDRESAD